MKFIGVYVGAAIAIVGIAAASFFGVMNAQYKVRFKLIEQDASYLKDNVYYKVAPKDIKQKIDNISKASLVAAKVKAAK
ncbi:MAG: hypothetical protein KJ995_03025 [Candidatus Omnitrophica bacterium]|nr:hypothetical protein [Candidatus Omnitrophota bacterium]MBU1128511.1 hypothetical protein [Candidatus Omnitrophota bacterium]MBU1784461.1 hypothetical protein [Candidatus Omnitrophota bacterium]MBU1851360.1 hypothetical protein [Candidatus Omnitrophota bacterium]